MRLLVDENLPFVEEFFADTAEVIRLPGQSITPASLQGVDGLLVRSVTRVDQQLLAGTSVAFVGTATIGTDHVDRDWLQKAGIAFASAPGCNADSVVDYVLSNLLWLAQEKGFCLQKQVIGIVGVGNVGGRLSERLQAYGCRLLLNDPPREAAGEPGFLPLENLLDRADILCLHTPLIREGPFPTEGLINAATLRRLQGRVLLNAGRGAVIDPKGLQQVINEGQAPRLLLDVFAGEPELDPVLIPQLELATPHIAGYSLEGKSRGTQAIYQAWCQYLGRKAAKHLDTFLPPPPVDCLQLNAGWSAEEACRRAALLVYDPREDAARLLRALNQLPPKQAYQQLRKNYPQRREFSSLRVVPGTLEQAQALKALGFTLAS
ncbi:erythronate-4-phosphate dehydrogenase [Marinospirillum celere]|uniref:Erythronate-4-phosphate dehydrogenase n=1 Tax=Marinospirillum celere TaxID=1122252 RepID=A0A1I1E1R7_9GAMM|nr:4-phosphoerythronate dehydrogenase [Marinospirillum celere]SFB79158.1 erythronate-4-phosphate dehydrogenase [Marinospirillum celere]